MIAAGWIRVREKHDRETHSFMSALQPAQPVDATLIVNRKDRDRMQLSEK